MEHIKGFIFDYGGTLDTAGCHWGQMLWHSYCYHHVPVSEEQFREAYVYAERTLGTNPIIQSHYTFYKTLRTKVRIEMDYLAEKAYWNPVVDEKNHVLNSIVDDLYKKVVEITNHSRDVLLELKKRFPIVLVSNFYGNVNVVLNEFHLDDCFDSVIESAVVGIRKPDPRIYMLGVEAVGVQPSEIVVVGDSFKKDMLPAKQIGCKTLWFKGEAWKKEENDESILDGVISDISQVLEAV